MNRNDTKSLLDELDQVELNLLQQIWQLESSLLDLIRQVQDIQLQLRRLEAKTGFGGQDGTK